MSIHSPDQGSPELTPSEEQALTLYRRWVAAGDAIDSFYSSSFEEALEASGINPEEVGEGSVVFPVLANPFAVDPTAELITVEGLMDDIDKNVWAGALRKEMIRLDILIAASTDDDEKAMLQKKREKAHRSIEIGTITDAVNAVLEMGEDVSPEDADAIMDSFVSGEFPPNTDLN